MASGCAGAAGARGRSRRPARDHGHARALVAVPLRHRGIRRRVGVAQAAGAPLMALWQKLARVFGRRDRGVREEAERILLEADFGVAATEEILEEVARVSDGEFRAALERTIARIRSEEGRVGKECR